MLDCNCRTDSKSHTHDFFHLTEVFDAISSKMIHVINVKMAGSNMEESAIFSLQANHPGMRAALNVSLKEEIWLR